MARLRQVPALDGVYPVKMAPKFKTERCVVDGKAIPKDIDTGSVFLQRDGQRGRFACSDACAVEARRLRLV